ncbi:MFS transporter [Catenulispora subtropica]|uniref:MFS transporter n=1 Tax=Catenulispora subtropica TaxID=450798 RepID=A0ABN2S1E8_9ACTN
MFHRAEFQLFRLRPYRLFFTARVTSALSDAMIPVGLAVAALSAGYGAGGLGLVLAAQVGMFVVFVMVGGVFADRFGPRRQMIGADVLRFVLQGTLAAYLAFVGHPPFWFFLLGSLVHGTATGMFQPGLGSVLPAIAPGRVQEASGLLSSSAALTAVIGAAAGGGLVAVGGPQTVFLVDTVAYGVSAVCLLRLRLASPPEREVAQHWRQDIVEGWREFRSRTWFWAVIVVFALMSLVAFGPFFVLSISVLTTRHGSTAFGVMLALEMAGGVLGGLSVARVRPQFPLRTAFLLAIPMALPMVTIGVDAPLAVTGAAMFVSGWTRSMELVLWTTTGQTQIPPAILNRLYAYDVAGCTSLLAVGQALSGPEAALIGERGALLLSAAATVIGCAALLAVPAVRRLRAVSPDPLPLPALAG